MTRPDGSILRFVENCDDAGAGSLRNVAAAALPGDGIDLTALSCSEISVRTGTITLRDVTLIGPGQDKLKIIGFYPGYTIHKIPPELLVRFADHPEIGMISGNNYYHFQSPSVKSYYFSRLPLIYGWATWRRACRGASLKGRPSAGWKLRAVNYCIS